MMPMIPQAAIFQGCERLWLNISATSIFLILSFHAGSHSTIGVVSWTCSTSAVAIDVKRKLATKSCIASFLDPKFVSKSRGDTRFHRRSNSLRLPALSDPAARACRVWVVFPRRVPLTITTATTTTTITFPMTTTTTTTTTRIRAQPVRVGL